MVVKPHDECMHESIGVMNFSESVSVNFFDRAVNLGGIVRIGQRPSNGSAEVTFVLYHADGTALFQHRRPQIGAHGRFEAGGARLEVLDPLRRLRVMYDDSAVYLRRPLDLEDPSRAFGDNPHRAVKIDLDCLGLSPAFGGEADALQEQTSCTAGHYEQHIRVRGGITIDGRHTDIDALGLRDHSWGSRWQQLDGCCRRLTCEFDADFGFVASQIVTANGIEQDEGFVFRNRENHPVDRVRIHTDYGVREGYPNRIGLLLRSTAGELRITGMVLNLLPLRERDNGKLTRIAQGMTLWRFGPHIGYGLSEYVDAVA